MEGASSGPQPAPAEILELSAARVRGRAAKRAPRRGAQGNGTPTLPTPWVTYALMAGIALAYGVQLHFDTFSDPAKLVALGSGYAPLALWSEPWRLLSPAFLHGSPMHLLTNLYVLYAIGGFLERLLGGSRMAILFVLSVLGGSLLSGLVHPLGHSVGASGGLFGLLAVQGVLAWRGFGIIPEHALPGARKAAAINLGINILISTMPQIDAMAHLGGALAGGALSLSGLVFRGVPRSTAPALGSMGRRALPIVAGLCLTVLGGSLVVAWATGGAFVSSGPVQLERQVLNGVEFQFPVSRLRQGAGAPEVMGDTLRAGDVGADQALWAITILPNAPATLPRDDDALAAEIKAGNPKLGDLSVSDDRGGKRISSAPREADGVVEHSMFVVHETYIARLDLSFRSGQAARWQDVLTRVADSLRSVQRGPSDAL